MLIEFSVANYRSVKDKVTLSMVASSDTEHLDNTFGIPGPGNLRLLKSAAIYGANASGKSNVVRALLSLRHTLVGSAGSEEPKLDVQPFRLDSSTQGAPTEFEAVFTTRTDRFIYRLVADHQRIHAERLDEIGLKASRARSRLLFERGDHQRVRFGASWRGPRGQLKELMRDHVPLLSVAGQFPRGTGAQALAWFRHGLRSISPEPEYQSELQYTLRRLERDPSFAEYIRRLLRDADLGITDLEVVQADVAGLDISDTGHPQLRAALEHSLKDVFSQRGDEGIRVLAARAEHPVHGGESVWFDLTNEESRGTTRVFAIAGPWEHCLTEGLLLVVDEFEARLHPNLTRRMLQAVHASETGAQVLFTTHDSGLLDADLLRRDQVWFTEKKPDGSTDLYSLWDFRPRKDENLRKGYLAGRYGAVPFLGEWSFGPQEGRRSAAD